MLIVILTGSIAMGKSTVANLLRARKIPVFCADACVHALYQQADIVDQIAKLFSDVVENGVVNRQKLGEYILHNSQARQKLERFVHAQVRNKEIEFLHQAELAGAAFSVLDIALYFENSAVKNIGPYAIDKIIVVHCSAEQQRQRALARPNMNEEKLQKILALQLSSEEKIAKADYIIDNSGPIECTEAQLDAILDSMGHKNHGAQ